MRLDLYTKYIEDEYVRKNFEKLEEAWEALVFTRGDFEFFEFKIGGAQNEFRLYHNLGFNPNDIIVTKAIGSSFEFNYEKFNDEYLTIKTTGDLYLRCIIGNLRGDEVTGSTAFAGITDDLGGSGGAGGGTGDYMTYKGIYNASGAESQLDNAWKGDFYIISGSGNAFGRSWVTGDHLVVNTDVTGTPTAGQIDKIDNTLPPEVLQESDVVNDLITGGTVAPLSAQQGVALKGLIDSIDTSTVYESYTASGTISALKMVKASSNTQVNVADSTGTYEDAKVIGIAINAATTGQTTTVITHGHVKDGFFNFPLNAPLFVTTSGTISDTEDVSATYTTVIGHGLGAGGIFINIREPIKLL